MIRSKLLGAAAALVLGGGMIVASAGPASAQHWRHHFGWGPAAVAGGIVGGAVAAATSPLWAPGYYGGYDYGYGPNYAYGYGPDDYDAGAPVAAGPSGRRGEIGRGRRADGRSGRLLRGALQVVQPRDGNLSRLRRRAA